LVRSLKFLTLFFAALIIGSASLLTYSVAEGLKPVDRAELADLYSDKLPPLPKVGRPGEVAPEKELLPVSAQTAQEINAARSFSTATIQLAAPYAHSLVSDDEERAVACLAVAAIYEAGGNSSDQSAVIQVVLNRVRHPAFPSTACGVVFQGSGRSTGCQFSFTCDGSMQRRRPSPASWRSAAGLARAMLQGYVDARVGTATHYHTDWVVPYWSASLDKVTSVKTHLFFRWPGFWGTRAAFRQKPELREPLITALASLSSAHAKGATDEIMATEIAGQSPAVPLEGAGLTSSPMPIKANADIQIRRLALPSNAGAARWAMNAVSLCNDQQVCRVVGWSDPVSEPAVIDRANLSQTPPDLVFIKVSRNRQQQAYWDCSKWARVSGSQCLGSSSEVGRLLFAE
jgi:spore germination cell wall hydrolase CwlJ-like protein